MAANMKDKEYQGEIMVVNPKYQYANYMGNLLGVGSNNDLK